MADLGDKLNTFSEGCATSTPVAISSCSDVRMPKSPQDNTGPKGPSVKKHIRKEKVVKPKDKGKLRPNSKETLSPQARQLN